MFNNFGGHPAYQFQGNDQRGWTPPWLQEERMEGHHHPHHHPRGPRWWGPRFFMHRGRGPFGPGGEGRRFFGRGDVKFALLELLRERPMYGYEMMKALEEKSGGFYTPSAGTIYPTLQMLEDRSLVTSAETEGKKVYSITDTGRALLDEQQKESEQFAGPPLAGGRTGGGFGHWGPKGFRGVPEMQALGSETAEVARLFAIAARSAFNNPEQVVRLRAIIEQSRKDLSDLIYNKEAAPAPTTPPASDTTPGVEQA